MSIVNFLMGPSFALSASDKRSSRREGKQMMVRITFLALAMVMALNCDSQGIHRIYGHGNDSTRSEQLELDTDKPAAPAWEKIQQEILTVHCIDCHNEKKSRGRVRLDSFAAMMASMNGQLVVPGRPEESPLYTSILSGDMPRGAERLPEANIQALEEWILAGAKGPALEVQTVDVNE